MNAKLTAKETALMTAIAANHFSFFDQGLVDGSGIWTECMTDEIAGHKVYKVSDSQRGVATVIASLGRKGLLLTDTNEDGAWTELTAAGEAWITEHNGQSDREVQEAAVAERMAPKVVNPEAKHPGETTEANETFAVSEWADEDETEWVSTAFADGSSTLRRRRQVSGAWRTDFWGTTADGKKVSILSRDAKAAREAGTFTI